MTAIEVVSAGPGVTVQDLGRPGFLSVGISRGGAADPIALAEGAALLGQPIDCAAIEMAGVGGRFRFDEPTVMALTGAEMVAKLDGEPLGWTQTHAIAAGQVLDIGGARNGVYGYLHVAGGIVTDPVLHSRSTHIVAGLGRPVAAGDRLPVGKTPNARAGMALTPMPRFGGGTIRVVPTLQTPLFEKQIKDFQDTTFTKDGRSNRMGARMASDGPGFGTEGSLTVLSEIISPGDIQITGDGAPYVLMAECQTTGGYPRIGTVIPPDLPKVAQALPGTALRFEFITLEQGVAALRAYRAELKGLPGRVAPLLRRPEDMTDLLSYNLISGMIAGNEE